MSTNCQIDSWEQTFPVPVSGVGSDHGAVAVWSAGAIDALGAGVNLPALQRAAAAAGVGCRADVGAADLHCMAPQPEAIEHI